MRPLLVILLLMVTFRLGEAWYEYKLEPEVVQVVKVVTVKVEKPVIVEHNREIVTPVYIDKPVLIEDAVSKEAPIPQRFREFESVEELEAWLYFVDLMPVKLIASEGILSIDRLDCDEWAISLQLNALEQGLLVSTQLIENGNIFGTNVGDFTDPHLGNLTIIGNEIYYIGSIPPYDVVKVAERD
ncbi:MAG: hypothetical protein Q8Q07_02250 [Dehalococcoidales bacterium]|nr:hypothetical protein [Dehalococcoidales bacterium]